MSTHAPSPYTIRPIHDATSTLAIFDGKERIIACLPGISHSEETTRAIGQMLVAAPELLEAARFAIALVREEHGDGPTLRKLCAAVAKAEGRA